MCLHCGASSKRVKLDTTRCKLCININFYDVCVGLGLYQSSPSSFSPGLIQLTATIRSCRWPLPARTRTVRYGPRSFRVMAPETWNMITLTSHLKDSNISREQCKSGLKTWLIVRNTTRVKKSPQTFVHMFTKYWPIFGGRCSLMHSAALCYRPIMSVCTSIRLSGTSRALRKLWEIDL